MSMELIAQSGLDFWLISLILISAGFVVGIINTMAGSGTVITYSIFMALGMPAPIANGTIRLGVIMQTLAASIKFFKKDKLDIKKALILAIPVIVGSITGAQIAATIDKSIFEKVIGIILLLLLISIFFDPKKWINGLQHKQKKKVGIIQLLMFLAIGFYGGFIHIGVGIFLISALVMNAGYDLVRANAIKVFLVFLYSPFALLVYILHDQVLFILGGIAAIGNLFGGMLGAHLAINKGSKFVRYFLVLIIVLFSTKLLGLWDWLL
ncbi:MAG: sulfite exporter TauE/SafE family protein [Bacteroidales bacterium]|nr:sulfite exporter TauE/SafE family protein [Bacteroidales bacterium]